MVVGFGRDRQLSLEQNIKNIQKNAGKNYTYRYLYSDENVIKMEATLKTN